MNWPIVVILVCMDREDPYLPIDTKINVITRLTLVRRVTKNSLVRRGLKVLDISVYFSLKQKSSTF